MIKHMTLLLALLFAALAIPAAAQTSWSKEQAAELLAVTERVGEDGLDPADYAAGALRQSIASGSPAAWNQRATETFLKLAADLTRGHVRNRAGVGWHIAGPTFTDADGQRLLAQALGGGGVRRTLQGQLPQHRQYTLLKSALAATPARDRGGAQRLRANLERWRWMPRELGDRYLLVNVPAFTVSLVENNRVVARRKVIVGKPRTPTPQFAAAVTGVILNPWWNVPASIVRESVGALVRKTPALARQRGYVVSGGRYSQRPGPGNALGQIKLVMPNPYTVYLHDTPTKALFDEEIRAFSHGCIRTQDAIGLGETLLAGTAGWSRADIDRVIASGKTTQVNLARPLPVYIAYFTAAAEEGGEIATFADIYGRDAPVVAGLVDREIDTGP